jgi:predicted patatin/cPLA2 family phospholipase
VILAVEERLGLADRLAARQPLPLAMVATDVDTARPHPLTGFTTPDEVLGALKASGRLPVLAGPPATFRGRRWLDGGITEPVPVSAAIALGATHAIVVATRPLGSAPGYGPFDRAIALYLQRVNPALAEAFRERPERYRSLFTHLAEGQVGLPTVTLTPRRSDPVPSRLERDAGLLREAAAASADTARDTLAHLMS